jgi:iron complex outermembrane receptor protein
MLCTTLGPWIGQTTEAQLNPPQTAPIATQPLAQALSVFAKQTGLQLVYLSQEVASANTRGAPEGLGPRETLTRLLADTGLTFEFLNERTVRIYPIAPKGRAGGKPVSPDAGSGALPQTYSHDENGTVNKLANGGDNKERERSMTRQGVFARLAGLFAVCGALGHPDTSCAQAEASSADSTKIEEVIVTARKQEEKLLDTPVTLTVLTAEQLATRNIVDLEGVAEFTPGLKLDALSNDRNDRSNQSLIIRGMTGGTVSVFIDGAPVVGPGFVSGMDDLARVEVLKGPQSATFGRATFAGAINLVTKDPTDEFHTSVDAQVMSYAGHDVRGFIDGPLIPGTLDFHLEARDYSTGGDYTNAAQPGYKFGAQSTDSFNLILKARPTDNFSIKLIGNDWVDDDGVAPNYIITDRQYNCAAGAAGAQLNYTCGQLPRPNLQYLAANEQIDTPVENALFLGKGAGGLPGLEFLPDMGPGFSNHMGLERRAYHLSYIMQYDLPSIDASVVSNTSYDRNKMEETLDVDDQDTSGLPNPLYSAATLTTLQSFINWPFMDQSSYRGYSEDLRIQGGVHSRFHWLLGGSYVYEYSAFVTGALLDFGTINFQTPTASSIQTPGVFGSIGYDILPNLTLTFEGRYQADKQYAYNYSPTTHSFYGVIGEDQRSFIPRAFLQYHPEPNYMIYASYSQGVNPGGFNSNLLVYTPAQQAALSSHFGINLQVQPETLHNYELGVKGKFFDDRAQVTADVYHANWVNQIVSNQVSISNIAGIMPGALLGVSQNIGRTLLNGVEIEGEVIPIKGVTLNGGFGYTPDKIQQYVCLICSASITGNTNVNGNQLGQTPVVTLNLGGEYKRPIASALDGYVRLDWVYQGKVYEDPTNLAWIPPTGHVNLRLGVIRGNVQVEGWVTNLFDDIGYTNAQMYENLIDNFNNLASVALPPRRTFGLRLRASL